MGMGGGCSRCRRPSGGFAVLRETKRLRGWTAQRHIGLEWKIGSGEAASFPRRVAVAGGAYPEVGAVAEEVGRAGACSLRESTARGWEASASKRLNRVVVSVIDVPPFITDMVSGSITRPLKCSRLVLSCLRKSACTRATKTFGLNGFLM